MDIFYHLRRFAALLALTLALGCVPATSAPQPVSPINLTSYATLTLPVATPAPTIAVTATEIPIPTPTPFTYTIARGDTLSTIAQRFGLRVDDLQLANPGVVAEALSVGQTLKIPSASSASAAAVISTPVPADLGSVQCFSSGAGLQCLVPVKNPYPEPLENVKLQITLLGPGGESLASQEAFLPLNILPPESILPAQAFFPVSSADFRPVAQLANSIRLLPGDLRYLPVVSRNILVTVDWDGRSARVQGQVFLPAGNNPATAIWLAVVAYDENGQIAGFRRWEWRGNLQPGGAQPFEVIVYSFGPVIANVDVIAETRP